MQPQPKQEWSDEEVEIIDWLVASFDCLKIPTGTFYQSKVRPFLISLRNKIQPIINEWSEDDEQHIDSLLKRLDGLCRNEFERTRFAISEDRDWLESLRPRKQWKPSDKQIMALRWVLNHIPYDSHKEEINGLLEQLKKLREEKL